MTRRAFISCPLEAALAGINHWFVFVDACSELITFKTFSNGGHWVKGFAGHDNMDNHYIHPESLHLLDLKGYDFVSNGHDPSNRKYRLCTGFFVNYINEKRDAYIYTGIRENGKEYFCEEVSSLRIIQRNGKPFPKIEWEEL